MTPPARNRLSLVTLVAAAIVLCGFTAAEGRRRAEHDVAVHHLHLYIVGRPASGALEYRRILRREYGVAVEFAGCRGPRDDLRAYNVVVTRAIEQRYGRGVLRRAWARAARAQRRREESWAAAPGRGATASP